MTKITAEQIYDIAARNDRQLCAQCLSAYSESSGLAALYLLRSWHDTTYHIVPTLFGYSEVGTVRARHAAETLCCCKTPEIHAGVYLAVSRALAREKSVDLLLRNHPALENRPLWADELRRLGIDIEAELALVALVDEWQR